MEIFQFSIIFTITILYYSTLSECVCLYTLSRSYSRNQPIYFIKNIKKAYTLAIPKIIDGNQVIEIQESDTLIVSCPDQHAVTAAEYYKEEFYISCKNGTTQIKPDNNFNPDHFKCKYKVSTSQSKPEDKKVNKLCEAAGGTPYNVGIHVNFKSKGWKRKIGHLLPAAQQKSFNLDWYTMYTSCYNIFRLHPIYTHYTIDGNLIAHRQIRLLQWKMDKVDVSNLKDKEMDLRNVPMSYHEETAWRTSISKIKEFDFNRYFDFESRNVVAGLLVPEDDMLFLAWKHITHSPFNVAPMWRQVTCSWRNIERMVKSAALKLKTKLNVYTGINQALFLFDMKERPVAIKLHRNLQVYIPLYFWKLVYHEEKKQAIVFVLCNNPYKIDKDADTEELCPKKKCNDYGWNVDNNVLRMGQVYCCTAEDFFKNVNRFVAFKTHLKIEGIFHKP